MRELSWGRRYLMCPPHHFGVLYEINPWMHREVAVDHGRSEKQWHDLVGNLRSAGATIELLEQERKCRTDKRAGNQSEQQVHARTWCEGAARCKRGVYDRHIVGAHPAGDADFLVTLKKPVIQHAIGICIALEDVVLDAAPAQVEHAFLQPVHLRLQRPFALDRSLIIAAQ